jgi:hypothetical protein
MVSVLGLLAVAPAHGAGYAFDENFIVHTPEQAPPDKAKHFAEEVLARAAEFRGEVAREWLGEELPDGEGRTVINVEFSSETDQGLTWAKDHPDRTLHSVFLVTSRGKATGSTLHHEIAHTVFATRYPHPYRLPSWLEEGIACRYDDEAAKLRRRDIIRRWTDAGRMPRLAQLLEMSDIVSYDDDAYAAGTSLVSFLLTRGDRMTLLNFAESGQQNGWARALRSHYGIAHLEELQAEWEAWVASTGGGV